MHPSWPPIYSGGDRPRLVPVPSLSRRLVAAAWAAPGGGLAALVQPTAKAPRRRLRPQKSFYCFGV